MTEHRSINALAESFFATYKLELIEPATWPTRARARTATVHWLEAVYNRQHRHSAIDMLSPVAYEGAVLGSPRGGLTQVSTGRGKISFARRIVKSLTRRAPAPARSRTRLKPARCAPPQDPESDRRDKSSSRSRT